MKGLFIPGITAEAFRGGCLESIEALMAEGEIYDIECDPSAQQWIPCSERLPEEDHWLGGSGKQFSEKVLVSIANHEDEDIFVDVTYTMNGEWMLELPRCWEIVAWMPLPEPWRGEQDDS